jgi:hypothetical protein
MHNNFRTTTQCTHVAPDLINLNMKSNPPCIHDHHFNLSLNDHIKVAILWLLSLTHTSPPMIGENRQLVTDEPVEFEK